MLIPEWKEWIQDKHAKYEYTDWHHTRTRTKTHTHLKCRKIQVDTNKALFMISIYSRLQGQKVMKWPQTWKKTLQQEEKDQLGQQSVANDHKDEKLSSTVKGSSCLETRTRKAKFDWLPSTLFISIYEGSIHWLQGGGRWREACKLWPKRASPPNLVILNTSTSSCALPRLVRVLNRF